MKQIVFAVLAILPVFSFAQFLEITDGFRIKSIPTGSYLEVIVKNRPEALDCCTLTASGTFVALTQDSITLKANTILISETDQQKNRFRNLRTYRGSSANLETVSLAKEDVLGLKIYNSARSKRSAETFSTIGNVLFFSGLVTIVNQFMINDPDDKSLVLTAGLFQTGFGLVLGISNRRKQHRFRDAGGDWRMEK